MHYAGGRFTLVFNGEIYNYQELRTELFTKGYKFETAGDSEVLLASYMEWGEECLSRLNGMFAFAIYDRDKDGIFMARDRAGEKPLFYTHIGTTFIFASELKALFACPVVPRKLDLNAMNYYMAYGYVPGEMCIIEGIRKLRPAHALCYDRKSNQVRVWSYWELPVQETECIANAAELVEKLEDLLEDAVKRQLVADVPVAVLLSGGVDSSLITALAAKASARKLKTFTVSFPGHRNHDESGHARLVADHFGTEHTVMRADDPSFELLATLARQYDEPLGDTSIIPTYLVSRLVRQHASVAIGGDGGDELFGGYLHYDWLLRQDRLRKRFPAWLRNGTSALASRVMPLGMKGRGALLALGGPMGRTYSQVFQYFDARSRRTLLPAMRMMSDEALTAPEEYKGALIAPSDGVIRNGTTADFLTYLPDDVLTKVDRASMLASLEVRAPLLDHRVIEFAFRHVPDSLKAVEGERKILLKMLAKKLLPPALDINRKQGFSPPLADWLRNKWANEIKAILLDSGASFARRDIERLLAGEERGLANSHRIFALTMFALWRKEYGVT